MFKNSESIHLNNFISTGIELNPTSVNINIDNIVVYIIEKQVIKCVPFTPIFLPNIPGIKELKKGRKIKVK